MYKKRPYSLGRLSLIAGCSSVVAFASAPLVQAATPAKVLVIGKATDPQTLDPAITMDNNDWTISYPAYQKLVRYKGGSTQVEGDLASNWTASPDQLNWTFTLKAGQRFSDGSAVTAEAVKRSFDRLFKIGQGPADAFPKGTKVNVINATSVKFTLPIAYAPFLSTLAHNGASIINPNVLTKNAADDAKAYLARNTAGSGPFQLSAWQKGQSLTLAPNPHYGGPKPKLTRVVVKIIGEASSRRLQLERGDLDIVEELPVDQITTLKNKPGVRINQNPSLRVTYLYLNNKRAPLNDVALRRAISYATDYRGIIQGVLQGKAKQMRGAIPEGMWGYDAKAMQYSLDINRAKTELAKSKTKATTLSFLYSDRDSSWEPIALSMQASLAKLGIKLKLEKLANATMRDRIGKADYDISIGNWSPDFADPYMFMNYWFETSKAGLAGNRSFYNNKTVNNRLLSASVAKNQAERIKLYQSAQKVVIDEAAYVYLYQKNSEVAMRQNVQGFVFNPMLEQVFNLAAIVKN